MPSSPLLRVSVCVLALAGSVRAAVEKIVLSPEEARWVAAHPRVRLGVDPAWPPFSFIGKDGRHQGIDAEILQLLSDRIGITFDLVPTDSWSQTEAMVADHLLEVVPGTSETAERAKNLNFTQPYFSPPMAVIMRDDAPFWVGLHALDGHRVAAARGYVATAYLQREFPEIPLELVNNAGEALELVARRRADAFVGNLVTASHLIRTQGLTNLKIVGLTELDFDLRLAVKKDEPELLSILNKALATLSEHDRHAIVERWISVNVEDALNWHLIRRIAKWILLPLAGILLATFFWNRRLARELIERRKVEAALRTRESELEAANASLKQLGEDRRMLMNMLAHDLNGPRSVLLMSCEFLRGQIPPEAKTALRDLNGMHDGDRPDGEPRKKPARRRIHRAREPQNARR